MKKRKTLIIGAILIVIAVAVSFSQTHKPFLTQSKNLTKKDTAYTNPKIDIKVKKEYDDEGNMIHYDSSYTYIYTYPDGNTKELNMDSIFNTFKPYFFNHGMDIMHQPFNNFFDLDTTYQHNFFDHDFFMNQFENEMFHFEEMMHQMDSLRNQFLKEMYPNFKYEPLSPKKNKTKSIEI